MQAGGQFPESPKKVKAVPVARWKARREGIDLSLVKGSGTGGVILPRDIDHFNVTQGAPETARKEERLSASTLAEGWRKKKGYRLKVSGGPAHGAGS